MTPAQPPCPAGDAAPRPDDTVTPGKQAGAANKDGNCRATPPAAHHQAFRTQPHPLPYHLFTESKQLHETQLGVFMRSTIAFMMQLMQLGLAVMAADDPWCPCRTLFVPHRR